MLEWLKTIAEWITIGEYERIKNENKRQDEYAIFIALLEKVAKKRLLTCKANELSNNCPIMAVIPHYHQQGKTTDGTASLRIFTIMGISGQIINIQCFDLTQKIKITVQHTNGISTQDLNPSEALKRIESEAVLY